ncbi:hypothetical protein LY28_03054 [Ruminiclostridium sufflavum DSM 19573]|uniref:Uncharacterized protein n=1 Tax=Ruminiclostridium sufflavum DSM 19573 TaxID=1121337 RepID=A0A318XH53_9FIRM|nr:hypothetical protein [Ruminiclostridium sufflavum]PYG85900.1 hypothetical protein LY28_03054 [Ruminiclostridium sufflavum DSM 19573]
MKKPSRFILHIKRISRKYKKLGNLIVYIYRILKSSYIRTFVNFTFTTVLTIQMKLADFETYKLNQEEFYQDKWHILITCVFIVLYNWATILIDNYQKYQEKIIKCVKEIVNRETVINDTIGKKLYEITKCISAKSSSIPVKSDFVNFSYQDVAALVCHNIYDAIKVSTEKDSHQVSLMQRFKEKKTGVEYIKMISYGNANQITPSIFDKHFYLDYDQNYFHVKIFNENQNNIFILKNAEEIKKHFVYGKRSNEDEIVQYIAIPVVCENEGIVSLLQIEIKENMLIGRTKEEIREFVKPFMAYIHVLTVSYYQEELFKVLAKKFDILKKSKDRKKSFIEGMSKYEQH